MFRMILIKYFLVLHIIILNKSLLITGLNFAILPKKIKYSKVLLSFELIFHDIKSDSDSSVDLGNIQARLQHRTFTSYSAFLTFQFK